jgi:ferredoxin-type protein NapG
VVASEHCTGCGLCERACILEEAAIKVMPIRLARGGRGLAYRLDRAPKRKAGGAPVTPDTGRGPIAGPPSSRNALETLGRGIEEAR